ncbi:MAG TPA: hypothetical protein VHF89_04910, partial [Solirubrobacteraceae bacterium]|nr:hypothetical protein [Solirubrobacteraceae bacterium]
VELTPTFRERAQAIWGPLGGEARRAMDRFSAEELRTALAWFELSREVNEKHAERIRGLRFS